MIQMQKNILNEAKNIHFIGIGGIGISAIARMLMLEGKTISGSDNSDSKIIESLRKTGIKIEIGQKAENIPPQTDLVIHTIAVTEENRPRSPAAGERRLLPVMRAERRDYR